MNMQVTYTTSLKVFIKIEKNTDDIKKRFILSYWRQMTTMERFVFNKTIYQELQDRRVSKPDGAVTFKTVDLPASVIAHRISAIGILYL